MNIFDIIAVLMTVSLFVGIVNIESFFSTKEGEAILKKHNKKEVFIDLLNPFGNKISKLNTLRQTIYAIYGAILNGIFLIFIFYLKEEVILNFPELSFLFEKIK